MSVIQRPDGFYWKDDEDDREYGPFATLLEAGQPDLNEASRAKLPRLTWINEREGPARRL